MERMKQRLRRSISIGLVAGGMAFAGGCAISQQQEVELGQQYSAQVESELPIVHNAAVDNYINALGGELARLTSRSNLGWRFRVVNTNVVNAFAVPGGFVYVNRGLIERTANMSELAGVLAHEIGHVEHRHSVEQLEQAQRANLGLTLAYVLLGRNPSGVERAAIDVGGGLYFSSHSRDAEREADGTAINLLVRAGIDPNGVPSFFQKLLEAQNRGSAGLQWFSTHPTTQERITTTRATIARIPSQQLRGLRNDSDAYRSFKNAVRNLPAPPAQYRASR
jgi:predicted Zn-dependent protease